MRRELDELAGGEMISGGSGELPPAMEEEFLTRMLAFEKAPLDTNFNRLRARGVALVPPDELDDKAVRAVLGEVLRALGEMRCFVEATDHLSDRELYAWLWREGLRDETPDLSTEPDGAWHTSPIGGGSEEDIAIHLTYYADEEERRRWRERWPDDPLPPHAPLPYDRDRHSSRRG